jgi:hypothetical protein
MTDTFTLYQTLCCNIPKKEPTLTQKKELAGAIDNLYEHQKVIFIRLIIEHFRVSNKESSNLDIMKIPYEGTEDQNGISFDVEKFPVQLKWILLNFLKVCLGDTK